MVCACMGWRWLVSLVRAGSTLIVVSPETSVETFCDTTFLETLSGMRLTALKLLLCVLLGRLSYYTY